MHFHCPRIKELNPSACDLSEDNPYHDFMRAACMETCKLCGDEVITYFYFELSKQIELWVGM